MRARQAEIENNYLDFHSCLHERKVSMETKLKKLINQFINREKIGVIKNLL